ncbi:hypothetical protein GQ44DRAFT_733957 [Phaeosphaeriaceae sp. PMI808]|nr:hypothetical protein GQ44DRAFT_733957 [Phaeosphaeriaceae sp. PMI808]
MSTYSLDILSACWNQYDVTQQVRNSNAARAPQNNIFRFTPSNDLFGDPERKSTKIFTLVWRVYILDLSSEDGQYVYSQPQTSTVKEGNTLVFDFSKNLTPFKEPRGDAIIILSARYFINDVTETVVRLVRTAGAQPTFTIHADNTTLGGDPAKSENKSFTVTYGYMRCKGLLDYNMQTCREGGSLTISTKPSPLLTIHAANFGGMDVTDVVQQHISSDQTYQTRSNTWPAGPVIDPKRGATKTLVILYQYDDLPFQLLVAKEDTGIKTISPQSDNRSTRIFFNPNAGKYAGDINILAIVWGAMANRTTPFSSTLFLGMARLANEGSGFECTNENFDGYDGLRGEDKTAVVFYSYGLSGKIQCASAWEGHILKLQPPNVYAGDPMGGKKLLATTPAVDGFFLKAPEVGKYLTLNNTNDGLVASAPTRDLAARFYLVDGNGVQSQALKIVSKDGNVTRWTKIGPKNSLTLGSRQSDASFFNYELVLGHSYTGLLLGFTQLGDVSTPSFALGVDDETSIAELVSYTGTREPGDCILRFELNIVQRLRTSSNSKPLKALPSPGCVWAWAKILKSIFFDLPAVLADTVRILNWGSRQFEAVVDWWYSLMSVDQGRIAAFIQAAISNIQIVGRAANTDLLRIAGLVLREMWDTGALWALYTYVYSSLSGLDLAIVGGEVILSSVGYVARSMAGPAAFYLAVASRTASLGLWCLSFYSDAVGANDACSPSRSLAIMRNVQRLHLVISNAARQPQFLKLTSPIDRIKAMELLLLPHMGPVMDGRALWPRKQAPSLLDWPGLGHSSGLDSNSALSVAKALEKPFIKELEKAQEDADKDAEK